MHTKIADEIRKYSEEHGVSFSAFAEKCGVSKSTISRIIHSDSTQSLNMRTLSKIASVLSEDENPKNKNPAIPIGAVFNNVKFVCDSFFNGREVYQNAIMRSLGKNAIYICDTIPEFLKTTPTLRSELGEEIQPENYGEFMTQMYDFISKYADISGIVMMDSYVINQLFHNEGMYKNMEKHESNEQIETLKMFFQNVFPKIVGYVVDFRKNSLTTSYTIDDGYGVQFSFGGYVEWNSEEFNKAIRDKVLKSIRNAQPINSYF